jgi:hypothetical protein
VVNYFVNDFPNRTQEWTSADGLWVASNLPEGGVTAELWGIFGGELKQIAGTELQSFGDSINISNMYTGIETGVYLPEDCLAQ